MTDLDEPTLYQELAAYESDGGRAVISRRPVTIRIENDADFQTDDGWWFQNHDVHGTDWLGPGDIVEAFDMDDPRMRWLVEVIEYTDMPAEAYGRCRWLADVEPGAFVWRNFDSGRFPWHVAEQRVRARQTGDGT